MASLLLFATVGTVVPEADAVAPAGKWTRVAGLLSPRTSATATTLSDGRVLVAGGEDGTSFCGVAAPCGTAASTELFDPRTGTWSPGASMASARFEHLAVLLRSGKVLVAAGRDGNDCGGHCEIRSAELYDPTTNSWSPAGAGGYPGGTITLLADGRVLAAGGEFTAGVPTEDAGLYDPATNQWSVAPSMLLPRTGHTATLLPDGRVLVVGGADDCCFPTFTEVYDPARNTWSASAALPSERGGHTATLLHTGRVLVAGGGDVTSLLYDPTTDSWAPTGTMSAQRFGHHATRRADGQVVVSGGGLAETEVYNPTGAWTRAQKMKTARSYSAAATLPSGALLEIGGSAENRILDSVEMFQ